MYRLTFLLILSLFFSSCEDDNSAQQIVIENNWTRHPANPVFRDFIPAENYEVASDSHVFFENGELYMIYSGDVNGNASIKLARGSNYSSWEPVKGLLSQIGPSGLDINKETSFYRKSNNGKHQIYYIGYPDGSTYESQLYLAQADQIEGPYTQSEPIVELGNIAGLEVELITSPSVVEHNGKLHLVFIGWDGFEDVTEIWIIGAESTDDGYTWTDFKEVLVPIGSEGQITKAPDGSFVAVRTGPLENKEAIYYATAPAPFGPWTEEQEPLLVQADAPLETDEIIAPQITFDPVTGKEYLYYTGADYNNGWWTMLATKE